MYQLIILQVEYWMLGYLSVQRIPPFVSLSHIEQKELRRIMYAASFSCWETGSHQWTSHPHMSLGEKSKPSLPPQTPPTWGMFSGYQIQYLCRDFEARSGDRKGNRRGVRIWIESVTGSMRWSASQQTFHRIFEWRAHTSKGSRNLQRKRLMNQMVQWDMFRRFPSLKYWFSKTIVFELKYLGDFFCTPKKGRRMWDMWRRSMCDPKTWKLHGLLYQNRWSKRQMSKSQYNKVELSTFQMV